MIPNATARDRFVVRPWLIGFLAALLLLVFGSVPAHASFQLGLEDPAFN